MSIYLDEYVNLVTGIERLLNKRLASPGFDARNGIDDIRRAKKGVIEKLLSKDAKYSIEHAFLNLDPRVRDNFHLELKYVNQNIPADLTYTTEEEENGAAEDAKTAKDSLEKLLGKKLFDWLRDLLEILNEILKLVFGVS